MTEQADLRAVAEDGAWSSKNEALYIAERPHDAKWCMAVVVGEPFSNELVAMVWGYSPEGCSKRATLIAAAPALLSRAEAAESRAQAAEALLAEALEVMEPLGRLGLLIDQYQEYRNGRGLVPAEVTDFGEALRRARSFTDKAAGRS